ncbi:DUF748 domain-containing protein [Shewanella acanthi]|uniref:DUF748 domain-containing protein n=1 Tax=Shewanella acanthi TaxID=2864212 RepID=UPI001C656E7B|nr:DUF748 domain-containing protein [Shewanella acanthi]QYJ77648.1 DUF748 domain-containing protein [Shewanella acanthi]
MPMQLSRLKLAFSSRPRYQRILFYTSAAYLGYLATLGWIIPQSIVAIAPEKISALLHRPVNLHDVSINPFSTRVKIVGLELKEIDKRPFAGISQLEFELNIWESALKQALVIKDIKLEGPYANIERALSPTGETQFNFDDILAALNTPAVNNEPDTAVNTSPARIILGDFTLTAGQVHFFDKTTNAEIHYPDIALSLSQFDSAHLLVDTAVNPPSSTNDKPSDSPNTLDVNLNEDPQSPTDNTLKYNQLSAALKDNHDGVITLKGEFQLYPFKLVGDSQISKIKFAPLWSFIDEQFTAALTDGQLSANSQFQVMFNEGKPLELTTQNGKVTLENLTFTHQGQPFVKLPLFSLNDISSDLALQKVNIGKLYTKGLTLKAIFDEQGLDLGSLFTPKSIENITAQQTAITPQTTTENPKSHPWSVTLNRINVENYDIQLTEHKLTADALQWRIYPLNLATQKITSALNKPIDYQFSFNINDKGQFASQGQLDPSNEAIDAKLQLDKLDLAQFQPYLTPYVNVYLKSGLLSSEGQLSADAKGKAIFQGSIGIDELTVTDKSRKSPLLKWQKMTVNQLDFDQATNHIQIDNLSLDKPYAKVVIAKDRTTNISQLLVEQPESQAATTQPKVQTVTHLEASEHSATQIASTGGANTPELTLDIQKITVNDGSAFFADNSLTPNFASGIEQLSGYINHLSSKPGTKASVNIQGKIDRYAPVTLKGDINPLLEKPYLDLDLVFKNVELTSVNPYSGTYAGYYIDRGQLSLALNYQLEDNKLKGSNHLVVDKLKLGKRSNSDLATSLPVTLAIALLQDRHGVIDLGLDVSGDLNSPSFSIGSILMTALTNVVTKAVTAPFSLLAGLVSSDESLDQVNFAPGKYQINAKEEKNLEKLAKALNDRPMLKLNLEGSVDLVSDSQGIAERILKRKLARTANVQFNDLPTDLSPSQFPTQGPLADALVTLYEQDLKTDPKLIKEDVIKEAQTSLSDEELLTRWHIALYNLIVKNQQVTQAMLGDLAQDRAKAVKAYLVDTKAIAHERIFLLESRVSLNQQAAQVTMSLDAN